MVIQREKKIGVVIGNNDTKLLIVNNSEKLTNPGEYDVLVANEIIVTDKMVINSPGEYEIKGSLINTNSLSVESDKIDYCEVIIDGINILYCFPSFEYKEETFKEIEEVDVLVVQAIAENKDLQKLINRFDPEILAINGEKELSTKFLADNGITTIESEKKVKAKVDDFGSEEFILKTYILE
jgi:hypothetical protein